MQSIIYQKLSFLMRHGCKNMADERKLLAEVNTRQEMDGDLIADEVDSSVILSIRHLEYYV